MRAALLAALLAVPAAPAAVVAQAPAGAGATPEAAAPADTGPVAGARPDGADPVALEEEAAPEASVEPPARWTDQRVAGWVLFASSFVVGVGGGVVLAIGVDEINTVENAPVGSPYSRVEDSIDRAPILTGIGWPLLVLGAAGLGTAAVLLATSGPGGTWVEATASLSGVSLRGRF